MPRRRASTRRSRTGGSRRSRATRRRSGSRTACRCSAARAPRPQAGASGRRTGLRRRSRPSRLRVPAGLDGAADYLGLTEAQLREQLQAGKSLADVAKAQNKDVAGLKAALKTALTKQLDEAVKDGHLTAEQRTKILADVDEHLDDLINATPPKRPDGPKFRWR